MAGEYPLYLPGWWWLSDVCTDLLVLARSDGLFVRCDRVALDEISAKDAAALSALLRESALTGHCVVVVTHTYDPDVLTFALEAAPLGS